MSLLASTLALVVASVPGPADEIFPLQSGDGLRLGFRRV